MTPHQTAEVVYWTYAIYPFVVLAVIALVVWRVRRADRRRPKRAPIPFPGGN